jgi:glyoxylase-like metal-dependent hydrolase (beta-lactamase superfamily II)
MASTQTIGEVSLTRIEESLGPLFEPGFFLPGWQPGTLEEHRHWLVPQHLDPVSGKLILSVHSWLVRTQHHTILIDACAGNNKQRRAQPHFHLQRRPFLERLAAAGAAPEDIDYVLCTHLHADHVGWNTRLVDGRWVPTFPRATYVFSQIERDYWDPTRGLADGSGGPKLEAHHIAVFEDSVLPVIASGQAMIVGGEHRIGDDLAIEPAPGHTPGHFVVTLRSRQAEGMFIGDALHHPIQIYHPEWNSRVCILPEIARRTRQRILEACAERDILMLPAHFGAPYTARVRQAGGRFSACFE